MTAMNRRAGLMMGLATIAILGVFFMHGLDAGALDSTGPVTSPAHEDTTLHGVVGLCVFTITTVLLGTTVVPTLRRSRLGTPAPRGFRQTVLPTGSSPGNLRLFDLCVIRV